jgi:hypothetical protein
MNYLGKDIRIVTTMTTIGTEMYLRGTAINLKVIGLEISIFSP